MNDDSDTILAADAPVQNWTATSSLILLVEHQVLMRVSLTTMLESAGFRVAPVANVEEALEVLGAVPDIQAVVTDADGASPQGLSGFELALTAWRKHHIRSVVLSEAEQARRADLPVGAYFLAKPVHHATLAHLVQDLVSSPGSSLGPVGRSIAGDATDPGPEIEPDAAADWALTPRQQDVLELLMQGKSNRDIAQALGLSENTVKVHMVGVFRTLSVSSRSEAVLTGLKHRQQ